MPATRWRGLVAGRLARLGQVRLVWLSLLVTQPAWVLVPVAEPGWGVALFAVGTLVASAGMLLSVVWVLLSPLRSMRDLPVITSVEGHG
ncbi:MULTISPECIES: hypothetical protein [Saccharothrix]|uniref:hypothetical protein n=1 Tax=Saccharothrix TaxID=2071 RepID=UPI0013011395|nr:hypothetical protein [Saccharothrix sp. CB00851]